MRSAPLQHGGGRVELHHEKLAMRRCKGCGAAWPAHRERCGFCPAVLGDAYWRDIVVVAPELSRGAFPRQVLPVIAVAIELSGDPSRRDALQAEGVRLAQRLHTALPRSALLRTSPSGLLLALVRAQPSDDGASQAAQAASDMLNHFSAGEARAGMAWGLVDGTDPLAAAPGERAMLLARAAQPSQLLAGYGTATLLDGHWNLGPVGVFSRRPEPSPENVVVVLGRKQPAPTPSALATDRLSHLVGRERELATLESELAHAAQGNGRWCAIVAPAGAGKSALLRAWLSHNDSLAVRTVGAAASPFGQAPHAVVDQLLAALGATPEREARGSTVVTRLHEAITRQAVRSLLRIVIDDLHWADAESLATLRSLMERRLPRCLVVVALRSSFTSQAGWLLDKARCIVLPALDHQQRQILLQHLLPGKRTEHYHHRLATAPEGGNPLYLEHAAAHLGEAGPGASVPDSLHAAVLVRLKGLRARVDRVGLDRPSATELGAIEETIGEWLDRLETDDYDDRATLAQYLSLLEGIDASLVIAASIAGVPVKRNRRLSAAIERFYSASFAERVQAIEELAHHDRANAARAAASGGRWALRTARLDDASRFFALAARLTASRERGVHLLSLGDAELARGLPARAATAYVKAASSVDEGLRAVCRRRLARVALARNDPVGADQLLGQALPRLQGREWLVAACDRAYVRALLGDRPDARAILRGVTVTPLQFSERALLARTRSRVNMLTDGDPGEGPLRQSASSLLLEADLVENLAALLDTALLLADAAPPSQAPTLVAEAHRAARRLGNTRAERRLNAGSGTDWEPVHAFV